MLHWPDSKFSNVKKNVHKNELSLYLVLDAWCAWKSSGQSTTAQGFIRIDSQFLNFCQIIKTFSNNRIFRSSLNKLYITNLMFIFLAMNNWFFLQWKYKNALICIKNLLNEHVFVYLIWHSCVKLEKLDETGSRNRCEKRVFLDDRK